jgi:hypothetical protein
MTEARKDLIKALTSIQNHREFANQDILTITGMMDDEEVCRHLEACMRRIALWAEAA